MKLISTEKTWVKAVALIILYSFVFEILYPLNYMFAQTGPGQSESQGFSLGTTDGMVNKFTGDFSYSIPLMDVEGYPIVISYNQNVGMNTDASWVGLGWDLNIGSVSREMRGIPDDFNGKDKVVREVSREDVVIDGWKTGPFVNYNVGFAGAGLTALFGKYNNSMNGDGKTIDVNLMGSISIDEKFNFGLFGSLGFNSDSQNGVGRSTSLGIDYSLDKKDGLGGGLGVSHSTYFSSRLGTVSRSFGASFSLSYDKRNMGTFSVGQPQNFGSITTTPKITTPVIGNSSSLGFSSGLYYEISKSKALTAGILFKKYKTTNSINIINNTITSPAYGYFHYAKANYDDGNYIMDYNQSNAVEFSDEMKNLPFAAPTYDMFHFNAAGLSGTFRAQRSEIGTLKTGELFNQTSIKNKDFGAFFAITTKGNGIMLSVGVGEGDARQVAGEHQLVDETNFNYSGVTSPSFDGNIFFKQSGEMTPRDMTMWNEYGGSNAFHRIPYLEEVGSSIKGNYESDDLSNGYNGTTDISTSNPQYNSRSEVIATVCTPRTVQQELDRDNYSYEYFPSNTLPSSSTPVQRYSSGLRQNHHLSSIEVVATNGMKYYYGTPAYSIKEDNVTFSATGLEGALFNSHGQVEYTSTDASTENNKGRFGYYEKTTVPAYAHSFLLNTITTSDYIDRTGDGPSADDVGNYYKINHTQVYSASNRYSWRIPVSGVSGGAKKANFNQGLLATEADDMANYLYGEKELWYTHSVESKNMIAQFYISDREDGYAVDEEGFLIASKTSKKLDSIQLYNKNDIEENGINATPLQVVYFEYDYSLCKKFDRNLNTYGGTYAESGKLTLKKIRIKSGTSDEQLLYPYQFSYGANEDYHVLKVDRWGNYKPNDTSYPNHRFPYASQDPTDANTSANQWKLTNIVNPLGGETVVEYEADEYRYVQNKKAMKHYQILGMTNMINLVDINDDNFSLTAPSLSSALRASEADVNAITGIGDYEIRGIHTSISSVEQARRLPNNVVVIKINDVGFSGGTKEQLETQFKDLYFKDESTNPNTYYKDLYFKVRVKIDNDENAYEDVPVFGEIATSSVTKFNKTLDDLSKPNIKSIGLLGNTAPYKYGYIVLEPEPVSSGKGPNTDSQAASKSKYMVNPIQKVSWQFARRHLPDLVYADCTYDDVSETFDCDYKTNIDWQVVFGGEVDHILNKKNFCRYFQPSHSFVRLNINETEGLKKSSTARVKSITYKDNWDEHSGEYASTYTWKYEYGNNSDKHGVSAYEPQVGKDENPFYYWDRYKNLARSFPDAQFYNEEPIAELLFPSSVIGYEQVTVSFDNTTSANKVGKSISTFITAKDYPTVLKRTGLDNEVLKSGYLSLRKSYEIAALSQGYLVETNDFHGKPHSSEIVDALGNSQSITTYKYRGLHDKVDMLDRLAQVSEERIGVEYDIYCTSDFSIEVSDFVNQQINPIILFTPPYILPFFPSTVYQTNEKAIYTNTFNKISHNSAVVESIETSYLGSKNTAENLYYDYHSGNVIVSSLQDEYEDKLFSITYPAHWYFDNFRNAHREEYTLSNVSVASGSITATAPILATLSEGDLLEMDNGSTITEAQVLSVSDSEVRLIKPADGDLFPPGTYQIRVLETGRTNQLGVSMQQITTKDNSFLSSGFSFPNDNILSISAVSFGENKNIDCRLYGEREIGPGSIINPYHFGVKGDYRVANVYAFQSERISTDPHKTRFDGVLDDFKPFYAFSSGKWNKIVEPSHPNYISTTDFQEYRLLGDTKEHDEYGKPLEQVDQINVHGSVIYGYNNFLKLVPVAQAVNAKQTQIAFDGFEDYDYLVLSGGNNHFDFSDAIDSPNIVLSNTERHSGNSSLKVTPTNEASVVKDIDPTEPCFTDNIVSGTYRVRDCDCVEDFSPEEGKYVISLWAKQTTSGIVESYSAPKADVTVTDGVTPVTSTFSASGPIINGWQRIEGTFEIGSSHDEIEIKLRNTGSVDVFFDDVRIRPFKASMTTTVYDKNTLLPMARHDAYNFTTYFMYDENLSLVRVSVETIEGIRTISEQESGGVRVYQD